MKYNVYVIYNGEKLEKTMNNNKQLISKNWSCSSNIVKEKRTKYTN